jgi:hypothetical protein
VREIDVLNVRDDLSDTSSPPEPVSPGRSWRLVERIRGQPFTLFRFVSETPVHVNPDVLMSQGLLRNRDEEDSLVGLQLPRS